MKPLALFLLTLALMRMAGIDLAVYQSYAWYEMTAERTQSMGLGTALESTLSGEAPCERCLALQKEREKRGQEDSYAQSDLEKLKAPLGPRSADHLSRSHSPLVLSYAPYSMIPRTWYEGVALPPPEGVAIVA